ncbi:MAG TPA: hypothetical protein VLH79_15860 [Chthonomonadales bacterium]|nr:hypothetical protein [Chthonomonadales bacterium]
MSVVDLSAGPIVAAFATWACTRSTRWEAARGSALVRLILILATAIACLWLGEGPAPASAVGGLLVLLAVYAVSASRS